MRENADGQFIKRSMRYAGRRLAVGEHARRQFFFAVDNIGKQCVCCSTRHFRLSSRTKKILLVGDDPQSPVKISRREILLSPLSWSAARPVDTEKLSPRRERNDLKYIFFI